MVFVVISRQALLFLADCGIRLVVVVVDFAIAATAALTCRVHSFFNFPPPPASNDITKNWTICDEQNAEFCSYISLSLARTHIAADYLLQLIQLENNGRAQNDS